jgi:hypothetical protein
MLKFQKLNPFVRKFWVGYSILSLLIVPGSELWRFRRALWAAFGCREYTVDWDRIKIQVSGNFIGRWRRWCLHVMLDCIWRECAIYDLVLIRDMEGKRAMVRQNIDTIHRFKLGEMDSFLHNPAIAIVLTIGAANHDRHRQEERKLTDRITLCKLIHERLQDLAHNLQNVLR